MENKNPEAAEEKPAKRARKKTVEEKPKRVKKTKEEAVAEEKAVEAPSKPPEVEATVEEAPAETAGKISEEVVKKAAGKEGSDEGFSIDERPVEWIPRTELGKRVYSGEIASFREVMKLGIPVKEVGIIDKLIPGMKEEVIDVGRVQRVTDSGRRMRFRVVAVVGNEDGYIGIGEGKAKEVGPAIRKAIDQGKLSVREIKRGCGSWECGCGMPHSVPFRISGKAGSVEILISPAPKGVGLGSGEVVQKILSLAGIKDAWVKTSGHTRTGINFAHAVYNALVNTNYIKMSDKDSERLKITSGSKQN
ncbi:MAG: 30S ribosomal protein S5 [Candidatus Altiarchaeales archaeon]|nr:30S ribosomal protein S5 [Candidatus Altiarchaeales archaeon]